MKLASFADSAGIKTIENIEDPSEIRRRTDARISTIICDKSLDKWLNYLGTAYCQAFAQMFDDQGITGVEGWSSKPRKIVVIDKRTNYQGNIMEKEISTSLNLIGRAIQKALKLVEFCEKESFIEDGCAEDNQPLIKYHWGAKHDYIMPDQNKTMNKPIENRLKDGQEEQKTSEHRIPECEYDSQSDCENDPMIFETKITGAIVDESAKPECVEPRPESKDEYGDSHNTKSKQANALVSHIHNEGALGTIAKFLIDVIKELDQNLLVYKDQCDKIQSN